MQSYVEPALRLNALLKSYADWPANVQGIFNYIRPRVCNSYNLEWKDHICYMQYRQEETKKLTMD